MQKPRRPAMKKPTLPPFKKDEPTVVPEINSNPLFSMRIEPSEKQSFLSAASRDGFKSLAAWLKWLGRERVKQQEAGSDIVSLPAHRRKLAGLVDREVSL